MHNAHFPILSRLVKGKRLAYLDNAGTSQKPQSVIDALVEYYSMHNANVHRGIHTLSEEATALYEASRAAVASYINAEASQITFTRGTTEYVNLIAQNFPIQADEEIIVTALEHHSNLVPWQELAKRSGATFTMAELDENFQPLIQINPNTKLIAITGMSNVLGTSPDLEKIIIAAHKVGAKVFIDAAQLIAHQATDVKKLDCDYLAFSGHKLYGPTGVGVLYSKEEPPAYQFGGGMIKIVEDSHSTWADLPEKLEAGTPNIAGVIAFKAALDLKIDYKYEQELAQYAHEQLSKIPNLTFQSPVSTALSFTMSNAHPHDIASILDSEGVAIRAGHHCCQPLMRRLKVHATARLSIAAYNTQEDIDQTIQALHKVNSIFK